MRVGAAPRDPWYRGRVLLIGDAAHATTPHLAMGAWIAIEDAVVLGEVLIVENSLQLGEWEKHPDAPGADPAGLMDATHSTMAIPF